MSQSLADAKRNADEMIKNLEEPNFSTAQNEKLHQTGNAVKDYEESQGFKIQNSSHSPTSKNISNFLAVILFN